MANDVNIILQEQAQPVTIVGPVLPDEDELLDERSSAFWKPYLSQMTERIGENPHLSDADRQMIIEAEEATPPLPA